MRETAAPRTVLPRTVAPRLMRRPLLLAAVAVAFILAGTTWLWAYFGSTVFFETIRAGLVMCFG